MIFVFVKMQNAVPKLKSPIIKKKIKIKISEPHRFAKEEKPQPKRRKHICTSLQTPIFFQPPKHSVVNVYNSTTTLFIYSFSIFISSLLIQHRK